MDLFTITLPVHQRHRQMPASALFTFCILRCALIQKPEACDWPTTGDCEENWPPLPRFSLSFIYLSPRCLKALALSFSLLPPPLLPPPRPWLEKVASECQMYYRVSHGKCKHSGLPWEQGGLALSPFHPSLLPLPLFLSPLLRSGNCQRGGESAKQQRKRVCVSTSVAVALRGSIVAVVCLCFGCSARWSPLVWIDVSQAAAWRISHANMQSTIFRGNLLESRCLPPWHTWALRTTAVWFIAIPVARRQYGKVRHKYHTCTRRGARMLRDKYFAAQMMKRRGLVPQIPRKVVWSKQLKLRHEG